MDRIQAGDLKTFLSLQTNNNPVAFDFAAQPQYSQSDEAELQRLGAAQGVGYELNDDNEFEHTLTELGIDGLITRDDPRG
jgi:hypothetical protein